MVSFKGEWSGSPGVALISSAAFFYLPPLVKQCVRELSPRWVLFEL